MRRTIATGGVFLLGATLLLRSEVPHARASGGNSAGPPPGFSGGFDEPTCQSCHIGYQLNEPNGEIEVIGLPETYAPGATYALAVTLRSAEMGRAGFQATLRRASDGSQAGELRGLDARVQIVTSDSTGTIQYAQHTTEGSAIPSGTANQVTWSFEWKAPEDGGEVVLNVAANSGNGDNSPLEDLVYTTELRISKAR